MLRRAGHWYSAVLPMVKQQIAKLKIEGRLKSAHYVAAATQTGSTCVGRTVARSIAARGCCRWTATRPTAPTCAA